MIFSRGRGGGRRKDGADASHEARHAARRRERDEFGVEARDRKVAARDGGADDTAAAGRSRTGAVRGRAATTGPYDIADAPSGVDRLDLGSLHIPAVDGVEVQLQADDDGQVQQVLLVHGGSALQLGVFAAPRTEGIWDEVCVDIRAQLVSDGATPVDVEGDHGVELRASVGTPQGPTELRFVGIDGPRWMVRAVYQGPAAADPDLAGPLAECLNGVVVDRGTEAMPVREALPLRLPREVADRARAERADPVDGAEATAQPQATGASSESRRQSRRRP